MQNYERERSTSRNMKKSLELRAAISGKQQKNTRTNQVSAQSSISIPNESPLEHLSRTGFFNCLYAMGAVRSITSTPLCRGYKCALRVARAAEAVKPVKVRMNVNE